MPKVFLSVAHHEEKQGASHEGITEWMESQRWTELLAGILHKKNIACVVVPTGKLVEKVKYINGWSAPEDIAIEIHFNAGAGGRGSETLYYPKSKMGLKLAQEIQQAWADVDHFQPNRGAKEGWYRMDRPNFKDYAEDVEGDEVIDYFLRKTNIVSVIPEPEFIHNYDTINIDRVVGCATMAEAIEKYFEEN